MTCLFTFGARPVTHEQDVADQTQRQIVLRDGVVTNERLEPAEMAGH